MIVESENGYRFTISHHFESNVRMSGDRGHPARVKRLAQEAVTLSTSLPLSFSSSVFVRCDTDRLDIMKVNLLNFNHNLMIKCRCLGPYHWTSWHALRKRLFWVWCLLPARLSQLPDDDQPGNNRSTFSSIQSQLVQRRKSLLVGAQHLAWSTWGKVERADFKLPSSPRVDSVADSRFRAIFQRTWFWALERNAEWKPQQPRVQQQHLPGMCEVGDARAA